MFQLCFAHYFLCLCPLWHMVSCPWCKCQAVGRKSTAERKKVDQQKKLYGTSFSANKLTFHQVLLHVPFTFIGLRPCSITKVLTGVDYPNKSCGPRAGVNQRTGMQKGLPEGQHWPGLEPCPKSAWQPPPWHWTFPSAAHIFPLLLPVLSLSPIVSSCCSLVF